jgi:hypothetical protein
MKETPLETGFEYTMMNWGSLTNKGFELALSTRNIDKETLNGQPLSTLLIIRVKC